MLGYSASLSPDSQASDPSSRLVFIEGRTLVKFMIRAPDPRPPLATPTVLLLHEPQLFTSRNSNTASSKSRSNLSATTQKHLDPKRSHPPALKSRYLFFSQSSNPSASNTTQIETFEVSDLNSESFTDAAVGSVASWRSGLKEKEEKIVPMKSKTQMRAMMKQEKKMATARRKERKKGNGPAREGRKEGKRKERKGNENEMSGPAFLNYRGKDNKIYKITNLPLY